MPRGRGGSYRHAEEIFCSLFAAHPRAFDVDRLAKLGIGIGPDGLAVPADQSISAERVLFGERAPPVHASAVI